MTHTYDIVTVNFVNVQLIVNIIILSYRTGVNVSVYYTYFSFV